MSMEGRFFKMVGYDHPKPNFRLNGGRGMIHVEFMAGFDIHFLKYDEHLTISRPNFQVRNIIFGQPCCDFEGTSTCVNHKSGERVELKFFGRSGNKNSYLEGAGYDAEGNKVYDISGSWLTSIQLRDLRTG